MKKIIKKVLIGVLAVILIFVVVVALQPADYTIVRTATIKAPPATVFDQVDDFHKWEAWSPWAKLDPNVKNTFEGAASGSGAVFKWAGNDKVGEGQMTILESKPAELIRIKLEFIKPFPDSCATEFTFKPENNQTHVSWTMTGHKNFVAKAVCMFMDMDKMVGGDFEKGLAQMKTVAEAAPQK